MQIGSALYLTHHDPEKLERYYRDLMAEQGDNGTKAKERIGQIMSETREAVAAARVYLRFINDTAQNHNEIAVRNLLSELLTDGARADVRRSVPASMRVPLSKE